MHNPLDELIAKLSTANRTRLANLLRPLDEPLAIVGMSCRFPGGANTTDRFWTLLSAGSDAVTEVPPERWNVGEFYDPDPQARNKMYTRWGGFIPQIGDFDPSFFGIAPQEALRMDPQQRLLLEMAWELFESAGYAASRISASRTGVFLGVLPSEYLMLQNNAEGRACFDDVFIGTGNSSSMAAGRISHFFNLNGPCLAVDTACSSSLVAVHLACQSIRSGECDLALAGGVNAALAPETFIQLCKLHMLAKDGRCKAFDAAADGFVIGEGGGMVALKRWSEAMRDGDHVFAVILGSAVNEDGKTSTITAPNGLAQQAVIRSALTQAGVSAQQIDYVEAHGSGTPMGDPIEVEAMAAVLCEGRSPDEPLITGTVKANIGHLEAASGIAGLIKMALALDRKWIPAQLHFKNPNPAIEWAEHPIRVPEQGLAWPEKAGDRMGGVSSFGWSGTNAHVVLREAAVVREHRAGEPPYLLALSAKSASALKSSAARLAAYLETNPSMDLADVSYTLAVGRQPFPCRSTAICDDRADAVLQLRRISLSDPPGERRGTIFRIASPMERARAAVRDLYWAEPSFTDEIDRCCSTVQQRFNLDIRHFLFDSRAADGPHAAFRSDAREGECGRHTNLTDAMTRQAAAFTWNYTLARMLMSWNLRPRAIAGWGIGEYAAACLAGVMSLENALALVIERARLSASASGCTALAVSLPENAIQGWLTPQVELAVANGSASCLVAGSLEGIAALERRLAAERVAHRRIEPDAVLLPSRLDGDAAQLAGLMQGIGLNVPRIPFMSNLTGEWVTSGQATDPAYWLEQMRSPIRFGQAVLDLLDDPADVVFDLSGSDHLALIDQNEACSGGDRKRVFSFGSEDSARASPRATLMRALACAWEQGADIDWDAYWAGRRRTRVPLPTYPFERQEYWFAFTGDKQASGKEPPRQTFADWFSIPAFRETVAHFPRSEDVGQESDRCWIMYEGSSGIEPRIAGWLRERGVEPVTVTPGERYSRLDATHYTVRPAARADHAAMLRDLRSHGKTPGRIVHAWTLTAMAAEALELGFYSLLSIAQALDEVNLTTATIAVITNGIKKVTGREEVSAERAAILGPCAVIPLEYSGLHCQVIDLDLPLDDAGLERLIGELTAIAEDRFVALRCGRRWVEVLERIDLAAADADVLRENGVYFITGGFGGLGLAIAERLVDQLGAKVALVGRTAVESAKRAKILAANSNVLGLQANVSDPAQIERAVRATVERFGTIHGIIHAAGVPGSGLIAFKKREDAARVLLPKVEGTIALSRAVEHLPLDFFALFSSIVSRSGGLGHVDYSAANAFLDAFAHSNSNVQKATVSICWGEWQWNAWDTAAGSPLHAQALPHERRKKYGFTFEEGFAAFRQALAYRVPNVVVSSYDPRWLVDGVRNEMPTPVGPAAATFPRPALASSYVAPGNETERALATIWCEQLGIEEVGVNDNFFDLGGNSLVGLSVIGRIRREFCLNDLPAYSLYQAPTISALAARLDRGGELKVRSDAGARGALRRRKQLQSGGR
jgi:acyl transferase domain-containing protein